MMLTICNDFLMMFINVFYVIDSRKIPSFSTNTFPSSLSIENMFGITVNDYLYIV